MNVLKDHALILGGMLSCIAALLHIAIIAGGAAWYRFFGAGEHMARLAEAGSPYPALVTTAIATVLFVWGLYAFSGAGWLSPLPLLKPALVMISAIYLLRGLLFPPLSWFANGGLSAFDLWSSLICLGYGLAYALGTWKLWQAQP